MRPNEISYRGTPISEIIEGWSFPATVWLLLEGNPPAADQEDAVRRALVAACDHGLAAPSIAAARTVASTRGTAGMAVAAGLLAFSGPAHGGAAGACAEVLGHIHDAVQGGTDLHAAIDAQLAVGSRMPGFGHPYHERDPRVPGLLGAPLLDDEYRTIATALEAELVKRKGPRLHMNADAAVAALLMDAGMPAGAIDLVTSIGRTVGLAAHVREETAHEAPFRAPSLTSIEYVGPLPEGG